MKKTLFIISFIIISLTGFAQESFWSVTYQMAVPTGELSDFTGKTSFRGFGIEGRAFVDNNVSIGGGVHWNVFYEKKDKVTTEMDNLTVTGTHFNYVNAFPIYANAAYYFNEGSYFRPYMAVNTGVIYTTYRKDVGLYSFENDAWKFALTPEVGVLIESYDRANFTVNFRYNIGLKTPETDMLSYLGINVGVIWIY
jgi:hypothetical protein